MKRIWLPALLVVFGLVAAACGDDNDDTPGEATPAAEETEAADDAAAEAPGTIVEVATAAGDFTTLVAAVGAADLAETLSGEGPFTVFAPTDEAFAAALEQLGVTAEELLANPDLATILTYHVVPGTVLAADVVGLDGTEVTTVNGAPVTVTVEGDTVMINDATVVTTDIMASNGVIHVIDAVLLPPAE